MISHLGQYGVPVIQINLQHHKAASSALCKQIVAWDSALVLIQETWINGSKILGLGTQSRSALRDCSGKGTHSCNFAYNFPQFGTRDLAAAQVEYHQNGVNTCAILASVCMPVEEAVPTLEVEQLITYCECNNLPLIIKCDTNSHHIAWGNTSTNSRGWVLADYLATTNLDTINVSSEPTFV